MCLPMNLRRDGKKLIQRFLESNSYRSLVREHVKPPVAGDTEGDDVLDGIIAYPNRFAASTVPMVSMGAICGAAKLAGIIIALQCCLAVASVLMLIFRAATYLPSPIRVSLLPFAIIRIVASILAGATSLFVRPLLYEGGAAIQALKFYSGRYLPFTFTRSYLSAPMSAPLQFLATTGTSLLAATSWLIGSVADDAGSWPKTTDGKLSHRWSIADGPLISYDGEAA